MSEQNNNPPLSELQQKAIEWINCSWTHRDYQERRGSRWKIIIQQLLPTNKPELLRRRGLQ